MGPYDRAIDAGERQLRLSLRHDMGYDGVPDATDGPAAKSGRSGGDIWRCVIGM